MSNPWGLVAAGPVSRSFFARMPKLARHLGPIASTSFRLASRISNTLRAGTPVREFSFLKDCGFLLFCFPGGSLASLIQLESFDWRRKTIVFCDTPDDPRLEVELRGRGAAVASINVIADLEDRYFIVGDRAAVRSARTLARSLRGHALEISRERLLLFQSGVSLSGSFFTPLLETTAECLRQSGLEHQEAAELAATLFQHSLRTFKHAGRKSWAGPIAHADEAALLAQEQALRAKKPLMAAYFRDATRYSFELYQTFPELMRYNKKQWTEFRKRYRPS